MQQRTPLPQQLCAFVSAAAAAMNRLSRLQLVLLVAAVAAVVVRGTFILDDTPLHCSVRRSISPCTCSYFTGLVRPRIMVVCQKMESFESVIGALQNKFDAVFDYLLYIEYSDLHDLDTRRFNELGFPIVDLKLMNNNLRYGGGGVFRNPRGSRATRICAALRRGGGGIADESRE